MHVLSFGLRALCPLCVYYTLIIYDLCPCVCLMVPGGRARVRVVL